jgi:hypothetical protein
MAHIIVPGAGLGGNTEPIYEKYVLTALGVLRLKSGVRAEQNQ